MLWPLVALILGSLGFAASTVMRYKAELEKLQPKVTRAQKAAEKLEKGVEVETTRKHEDEEKRAALQKRVTNHKTRVAEVRRSIVEAEKRQEELEMAMYKKDFKKGR